MVKYTLEQLITAVLEARFFSFDRWSALLATGSDRIFSRSSNNILSAYGL